MFKDPFDPKTLLKQRCSCGGDHAPADHARLSAVPASDEQRFRRVVDAAVLRAVFPVDAQRRLFLKKVGAATAMAAIASVFPLATAREAFAQGGAPEKKDLKVGFIPITCATPLIMAHPLGFYSKQGLNVEVVKTAGWALIRDKMLNKEYDAAHMLSPMPLAISLGVGSNPVPMDDAGDPEHQRPGDHAWPSSTRTSATRRTGRASSSPCRSSTRCTTSCCATTWPSTGSIPTTTSQIRSVPPPEMVANLRAGNIDGYLGPDPFNQRAVYRRSRLHPSADQGAVGRPSVLRLHASARNSSAESQHLSRAAEGGHRGRGLCARKPENRKVIAKAIAPHQLSEPARDGARAGADRQVRRRPGQREEGPDRIDFDPFPWQSMAVWILTQMKRWG